MSINLKETATTRYLCAAAHLDPLFRNQVLQQIVEEDNKAFGVSYGVELVTVVKHCLAAQRRKNIRDAIVAALFIVAFFTKYTSNSYYLDGYPEEWGRAAGALFQAIFSPYFFIAYLVLFAENWFTRYRVIAKFLIRGKYKSDAFSLNAVNAKLTQKLQQVEEEQHGNIILYSGFSPFVGAGYDIGGWSFSIKTNKGRKDDLGQALKPVSFTISELYNHLTTEVLKLTLDDLEIQDKLCVNGQEIRHAKKILPDPFGRSCMKVEPAMMERFMENPTSTIRYYKSIQVISWKGELVLSIFLRFFKTGQNLFTEASYFLLPPLRLDYHQVDSIQPHPTIQQIFKLLGQTFLSSTFYFPISSVVVAIRLLQPIADWFRRRTRRREIRENLAFDYGATTSIRAYAMASNYQQYFQRLDKEMYVKIIERHILDVIIDFLDAKKIDTSDLKERQSTILNNGVIVSGGSIQAQSLAVGEWAKSIVTQMTGGAAGSERKTQKGPGMN